MEDALRLGLPYPGGACEWQERHRRIVRDKRSRGGTSFVQQTPPRWYRNHLNRRLRRKEKRSLDGGRWEDFRNRLTRDASWYW